MGTQKNCLNEQTVLLSNHNINVLTNEKENNQNFTRKKFSFLDLLVLITTQISSYYSELDYENGVNPVQLALSVWETICISSTQFQLDLRVHHNN